jgi:hypothetical protein
LLGQVASGIIGIRPGAHIGVSHADFTAVIIIGHGGDIADSIGHLGQVPLHVIFVGGSICSQWKRNSPNAMMTAVITIEVIGKYYKESDAADLSDFSYMSVKDYGRVHK